MAVSWDLRGSNRWQVDPHDSGAPFKLAKG